MVILMAVCLTMGFYLGDLLAEQRQLNQTNQELLQIKDNLKKELERIRNECAVNREKDFKNCGNQLEQQKATFDELMNAIKSETNKRELLVKEEKNDKFNDVRELYKDSVSTCGKHHEKCQLSLSECREKLDAQMKDETIKIGNLISKSSQCEAELGYKMSQLESCQARLNNSIELMKSKGIEVIY